MEEKFKIIKSLQKDIEDLHIKVENNKQTMKGNKND